MQLDKDSVREAIEKLEEANTKKDIRYVKLDGKPLFGDGSIESTIRQQLEWIERGRPKLAIALTMNYYKNIDAPYMLNLRNALKAFEEKNKRASIIKRQITSLSKLTGIEKLIKNVEIEIENSVSKEKLKEVLPDLKKLKEIYDSESETTAINNKIYKLVDKYNKKFKLL